EVHGYLTTATEKISKSGVHVDIGEVLDAVGVDALRWYFARRCRTRGDTDVTISAIAEAHDHDLADGLGNLIQRCTTLLHRLGRSPDRTDDPQLRADDPKLRAIGEALPAKVDAALDGFLLRDSDGAICALV